MQVADIQRLLIKRFTFTYYTNAKFTPHPLALTQGLALFFPPFLIGSFTLSRTGSRVTSGYYYYYYFSLLLLLLLYIRATV